MSAIPWSHFYVAPDGRITLFTLGDCEHCGGATCEPNAVGGMDSFGVYVNLGLRELENLPPEIWFDEELGHTTCDDCVGRPEYLKSA